MFPKHGSMSERRSKVSKIERLGLSDPDGTNFEQERGMMSKHTKELSSINSYKYLQDQYKDIKQRTDAKREFLKQFAKI